MSSNGSSGEGFNAMDVETLAELLHEWDPHRRAPWTSLSAPDKASRREEARKFLSKSLIYLKALRAHERDAPTGGKDLY